MAGMLASPPPYRPTWWFELIGNKNAWQWQAPTSTQDRREKERRVTLSAIAERCIRWLEASDFGRPYLDPPTHAAIAAMESVQLADNVPTADTPTDVAATLYDTSLMQDISTLASTLRDSQDIEGTFLDKAIGTCCRSLRSRLHTGDFTGEQIQAALEPLRSGDIDSRLSDSQTQEISRFIASNIVSSVAALRRHNCGPIYDEAWAVIVARAFSLEPSLAKFRLFMYIMNQANPIDLHNIDATLYRQMMADFVHMQAKLLHDGGNKMHWAIQQIIFADAIAQIPREKRDSILTAAAEDMYTADGERLRDYTWVLLQAQLGGFTTEDMATMVLNHKEKYGAMSSFEALMLAMTRLLSNGHFDVPTMVQLITTIHKTHVSHWTLLTEVTMDLGGTGALETLMNWLHLTSDLDILLRSLIISHIDPEAPSLAGSSLRVMDKLLLDRDMVDQPWGTSTMPQGLLALMDKVRLAPAFSRITKMPMETRYNMMELLEWIAYWHMESPHVQSRQAFRGAEGCLVRHEKLASLDEKGNLTAHVDRGSASILVVLTRIIVRDLEAGQWGRTSRLQWLVKKIGKLQGDAEARTAWEALMKWRQRIRESQRPQESRRW